MSLMSGSNMILIAILLSVSSLIFAFYGVKKVLKSQLGELKVESLVSLLQQCVKCFNKRLFDILLQFIFITNIVCIGGCIYFDLAVPFGGIIAFDGTVVLFSIVVFFVLSFFPNGISAILSKKEMDIKSLVQQVIFTGLYQNMVFYGVFLSVLILIMCFFNNQGVIGSCLGMIVTTFYFRSAGGAYKAASEHQQLSLNLTESNLTHPANVLKKTGAIITSVGGFQLDIYSSWFISIGSLLVFLSQKLEPSSLLELLVFPEIKWVLMIIILTGIGLFLSLILGYFRANKQNVFLDMAYFVIGFTLIASILSANALNLEGLFLHNIFSCIMVISLLGVFFFTNFLTSGSHSPIKYIARQAQFGGSTVLISSFFNGLVGNAVFTLIIILTLVLTHSYLGLIGLIMLIIYALSIVVVASSIKMFSLLSNQIVDIVNQGNDPIETSKGRQLSRMSYSLEAIGNTFSSVSGILTSVLLFLAALTLNPFQGELFSMESLFGASLGIVAINIFYALTISGTYETLKTSSDEIKRQIADIPLINDVDKTHPNIKKLGDQHAIKGLKAVTLPGIWILLVMILMMIYLSQQGVFSSLIGMFVTVFIYSFFWSIFGDSVVSVYHLMRRGQYGGTNSSVFKDVIQSFLYAHYFQWVLAPNGVIIMKLAGIIALILALK